SQNANAKVLGGSRGSALEALPLAVFSPAWSFLQHRKDLQKSELPVSQYYNGAEPAHPGHGKKRITSGKHRQWS
ncbi:MAG: hypothetical protein IKQ10_09970, partial [Oscillospiraceae bacterium]|nr:hypothetical protein [Oscillospiraceae bacterium]